jgi:hypothetical protein
MRLGPSLITVMEAEPTRVNRVRLEVKEEAAPAEEIVVKPDGWSRRPDGCSPHAVEHSWEIPAWIWAPRLWELLCFSESCWRGLFVWLRRNK